VQRQTIIGLFAIAAVAAVLLIAHLHTAEKPFVLPDHLSDAYLKEVGPVQFQDNLLELANKGELKQSGHELLHEVGEYLFEYYGPAGVASCKPYFDHGCYNGFILHQPIDTLGPSLLECQKAGDDALLGCIHAAGHVALASTHYDIPPALTICSTLAATYATSTLRTCVFGVFMETAFPHLRPQRDGNTSWESSKEDLSFPCDSKQIRPQYRPGCWRMQGTLIGNMAGVKQTVKICDALSDSAQRIACFDGFSDYYFYTTDINTQKIFDACNYTGSLASKNICLIAFVKRSIYYGQLDPMPGEICARIDPSAKAQCEQTRTDLNAPFDVKSSSDAL